MVILELFLKLICLLAFLRVKGLELQRPTLTATWIPKDQTITLTCHINGGTARSVGWYRNQGRKVISVGHVNNTCETSPPELPFSAKCLCLNSTVFSCTLPVEPSVHSSDEWECSFADNGLSIKSNGVRISGSNVSQTTTGKAFGKMADNTDAGDGNCLVEVDGKGEVNLTWTTGKRYQLMDALGYGKLIANYGLVHHNAHLYSKNDPKMYVSFYLENGTCQLTIYGVKYPLTVLIIGTDIDSVKVNGRPVTICKNTSSVWLQLKEIESESRDIGLSKGFIAGIVIGAILAIILLGIGIAWKLSDKKAFSLTFYSSTGHEVLEVSYCDRHVSVVVHRPSSTI
ncbi:uncharacterized protein LOC128221403 [Mya arenaria]|uniref:uncharacterized protein LOC128221403 n=1 Tax=Mya arenaria TaxID=6604 RepID=UPI0022E5ED13|nr:uncharacterized protein LOC128221403 [Mya arenaria]